MQSTVEVSMLNIAWVFRQNKLKIGFYNFQCYIPCPCLISSPISSEKVVSRCVICSINKVIFENWSNSLGTRMQFNKLYWNKDSIHNIKELYTTADIYISILCIYHVSYTHIHIYTHLNFVIPPWIVHNILEQQLKIYLKILQAYVKYFPLTSVLTIYILS